MYPCSLLEFMLSFFSWCHCFGGSEPFVAMCEKMFECMPIFQLRKVNVFPHYFCNYVAFSHAYCVLENLACYVLFFWAHYRF